MSRNNHGQLATQQLFRHGDVLVSRVGKLPRGAVKRPHLILAEGELTGHAHRVAEPGSAELWEIDGDRFLRVVAKQATLVHEEHGPITLATGVCRVWRQREYSPQEIRLVRD